MAYREHTRRELSSVAFECWASLCRMRADALGPHPVQNNASPGSKQCEARRRL
ncbi:hypothetical protein HMPREF0972_00399 [Actinomyces sp. oral taxon 848 str. F0332]|nr:hypothetical protein HMPREF0972_00399 [Actinomyces sp. oral taxon 848 str. F0332]